MISDSQIQELKNDFHPAIILITSQDFILWIRMFNLKTTCPNQVFEIDFSIAVDVLPLLHFSKIILSKNWLNCNWNQQPYLKNWCYWFPFEEPFQSLDWRGKGRVWKQVAAQRTSDFERVRNKVPFAKYKRNWYHLINKNIEVLSEKGLI